MRKLMRVLITFFTSWWKILPLCSLKICSGAYGGLTQHVSSRIPHQNAGCYPMMLYLWLKKSVQLTNLWVIQKKRKRTGRLRTESCSAWKTCERFETRKKRKGKQWGSHFSSITLGFSEVFYQQTTSKQPVAKSSDQMVVALQGWKTQQGCNCRPL